MKAQDLECPYCEEWCEVNHDDGQGYEEDVKHQMECPHCGKSFVFFTSISFDYSPSKADCLNGAKHKWEPATTYPKEFTQMCCTMCGEERTPTDKEMKQIMSE